MIKLRLIEAPPKSMLDKLDDAMLENALIANTLAKDRWLWFKFCGRVYAYRRKTSRKWFAEVCDE